jgi:hypothetical protein
MKFGSKIEHWKDVEEKGERSRENQAGQTKENEKRKTKKLDGQGIERTNVPENPGR